jgi:hypothetical protein
MKVVVLQGAILPIWLSLRRMPWSLIVAVALCVAALLVWLLAIPAQRAEHVSKVQQIATMKSALQAERKNGTAVPAMLLPDQRAADFYGAIGDRREVEQHLRTIFDVAGKSGVNINEAEYKAAFDKNGRFHTYQMQLPIKGSYGAIRQFCEAALRAVPFMALDEMSFKRDTVSRNQLEAEVRFTFYLSDEKASPLKASTPVAAGATS